MSEPLRRLDGLEITQIGQVPFGVNGPLGGLAASPFEHTNGPHGLVTASEMTWAFDETGRRSDDYFVGQARRNTLFNAARHIGDYCKAFDIADVVYLDRSARPMRVAVNEYERLAYPQLLPTPAHFLNPSLFVRKAAEVEPLDAMEWSAQALAGGLAVSKSTLLDKKDKPIILVDACLHTGETMFLTRQALNDIGFQEVHTAAHSDDADPTAVMTADVVLSDDEYVCKPFGFDFQLEATDGMYSHDNGDVSARRTSARLRAELRQLIRREFAESQQR